MDWTPLWFAAWCKELLDKNRTINDPLGKEWDKFSRKQLYVYLDRNGSVFTLLCPMGRACELLWALPAEFDKSGLFSQIWLFFYKKA